MGLLLPAVAVALLFGGDDDSVYVIPGQVPGQVPGVPGQVPSYPVDVPTAPPPGPTGPVTPGQIPSYPSAPTGPVMPADVPSYPVDAPVEPPPALSLVEVFDAFVRPVPTPGYLYVIKDGDNPSAVLTAAYGNASSFTWQCFTTSRWNLQEYGTEGTPGASWSKNVDGTLAQVTAAWFRMHEPVRAALALGRLPQRTILWPRGSNGQVQPRQPPLPLAGSKTFGTVMLPLVVDCPLPTEAPGKNPAPLFTKLGISIPEWSAWE